MGYVSLDDKYTARDGQVFMSGIQALVRLPMIQAQRDKAAGLNTAGFVTGYRGSPLGGYDLELMRAQKYLDASNVRFEPGLNEDLAMTAIWGTQQLALNEQKTVDGVFGIWYGKGPGVDRAMDVLRHGTTTGSSQYGGVLCIAGDDHGAKSSILSHQTDHNFMAAFAPVLYPSGIHEFVEFGMLGIAMSRYSGCWTALKVVAETAETSATVDLSREQREILIPADFEMPEGGLNIRWPDPARVMDYRLQRYKGFAALAFARANKIDRLIWDSPNPRFGIMTSGKSYLDVRQALAELGITEEIARDIGLRLYKVGMPWPLEPEGARQFAEGLEQVLVIEEKREMIEHQLKWQLFNWKEAVRPLVVGKHDENNNWLLPPENELSVGQIAQVIADRMARIYDSPAIRDRLAYFNRRLESKKGYAAPVSRTPYFCSGCPHNQSTKVPEGSKAFLGVGCHYMANWMDRDSAFITQMGGEGCNWIGMAPYTNQKHVFQNLGDGTYQHSGLIAIRGALAAKVNITYKILYNDAVAMTGGQHVEGDLTVEEIAAQVAAEGVKRIAVASEFPERFADKKLPANVTVHHRDEFPKLQLEFRDTPGTTVIIYDQICAAEKRRRRKRGKLEDPRKNAFINSAVCEGCGDCSTQSNCVSVEPLETEFGIKRIINQSSCNKDFSCLKGFCPSFITIEGGAPKKNKAEIAAAGFDRLPEPELSPLTEDYNILVTGIGGTGVLTVGAILGMAAHVEGKASKISDMTGMAQKGGAVYSHVRLGPDNEALRSAHIITGGANVLIACDAAVAASAEIVDLLSETGTAAIVNAHVTPTADFVVHHTTDFKTKEVLAAIKNACQNTHTLAFTDYASALIGDAIATNMFMLGYAWQKGLVPLKLASILEAIKLNGTAVKQTEATFNWGRLAAHDLDALKQVLAPVYHEPQKPLDDLDAIVEHRTRHLAGWGNAVWASRYKNTVESIRLKESALGLSSTELSKTVARTLAKLMSYKDEYEVARLYTDGRFAEELKAQFEAGGKITFHMAPPILEKIDSVTGRPEKRAFGAWMFTALKVLAKLKGLRGTALDPFARNPERKIERALITEYETLVSEIVGGLTAENYDAAVALAGVYDNIRGFGPVKTENLKRTRIQVERLKSAFVSQHPVSAAAE